MTSVVLVPYCPVPTDTGGKAEMWQHLRILRELGACRIVSARKRPVGAGWTVETIGEVRRAGFDLVFREDSHARLLLRQAAGILYAAVAKALRLNKAFGHANPYHRYAFPPTWWEAESRRVDLALINYSYWARLPCECPKVINLLDLWSDSMWGGHQLETAELRRTDLILSVSADEARTLKARGAPHVLWMPPLVPLTDCTDTATVAVVGSDSAANRAGWQWLESALNPSALSVHVYGGLSGRVAGSHAVAEGAYADRFQPYRDAGIVLMPTSLGMGVQIKGVEALACGRAIVARKGAMRGLIPDEGAWIEVQTAEDMIEQAKRLQGRRRRASSIEQGRA